MLYIKPLCIPVDSYIPGPTFSKVFRKIVSRFHLLGKS